MFRSRATALLVLGCLLLGACVALPQLNEGEPTEAALDAATPVQAPSQAAPRAVLRLAGWNVRKLGFEPDKDLARVAAIIERECDLLALVELMWRADGEPLDALLAALGPGWSGHTTGSARPNLPFPHAERYAVLYRVALVAPCAELPALQFLEDNDGSADSSVPDLFLREPALGCYRARDGFDFALGVYHARWGSGRADEIAIEVQNIDLAFDALRARMPGEQHRYIVGDFNLDAAALAPLTRARDRTRGLGSTLDGAGRIGSHLYDHLLADGDAANAALADDALVVDVRGEAFDPASFRREVSDHLPIVARLRLETDLD